MSGPIGLPFPQSRSVFQGHGLSPSPSPSASPTKARQVEGLLIPTDREREDLERNWLPKLGRLKVDREVFLTGYSLYSNRAWYLSRTHWSHTIVTQTGKPTDTITAYILLPDPTLSEKDAKAEISKAVQYLINETHAQQRKTEFGILLVNAPSSYGQDISPISAGDLRKARSYILVNTGLRRLGCGGRAALGMDAPNTALRRKFFEQYRLPIPPNAFSPNPSSPTSASSASPSNASPTSPQNLGLADPFTQMVIEVVKLIQGALLLWGMYGPDRDFFEVDGLFCDETKAGITRWKAIMGLEQKRLKKLDSEPIGGCIDPKTLSALLSSITSVAYRLHELTTDKVPNPFSSPRRFLGFWRRSQIWTNDSEPRFLDVTSIAELHEQFSDLPPPQRTWRGVAHATSALSANLKGANIDSATLRRRELRTRLPIPGRQGELVTGAFLITDDDAIAKPAPDVITTNLEQYIRGIVDTREGDWDALGARRVAELWNGTMFHDEKKHYFGRLRRKHVSRYDSVDEDSDAGPGMLRGITEKTGQVLKDGLALATFNRRGSVVDTSDDEAGPGPSTRNYFAKRQGTIPDIIEPDAEDIDGRPAEPYPVQGSPSQASRRQTLDANFGSTSPSNRHSMLSAFSMSSKTHHPSTKSLVSQDGSIALPPDPDRRPGQRRKSTSERVVAWRERGRVTALLRTSSDGANVVPDENGIEWEVVEPHGTMKGQHPKLDETPEQKTEVRRRASLQNREAYLYLRQAPREHLQIDVEMCSIVLDLRKRERELAVAAKQVQSLEAAIFVHNNAISTATRARWDQVRNELAPQVEATRRQLQNAVIDLLEDRSPIVVENKRINHHLSDDPHRHELEDRAQVLGMQRKEIRDKLRAERRKVESQATKSGGWFW